MFLNTFLLAISSSIDSLGIGITYGLRHTKLLKKSKIILFLISIFITFLSGLIGNILKSTLSTNVCEFIGSALLLCMGFLLLLKQMNKKFLSISIIQMILVLKRLFFLVLLFLWIVYVLALVVVQ